MYKLDLHTHSIASEDGSLTLAQYRKMLDSGRLDYIAITDHDSVAMAMKARKALGERIIIGEEIGTRDGEIVGLYLTSLVPGGLSLEKSVRLIRAQGGIVYVPHPFETVRRGLSHASLTAIADDVDIMEIYNARAFIQNRSMEAIEWAEARDTAIAASSDAHGWAGWGRTYSLVKARPTADNLVSLLKLPELSTRSVGFRGLLYPKLNRIRNNRRVA